MQTNVQLGCQFSIYCRDPKKDAEVDVCVFQPDTPTNILLLYSKRLSLLSVGEKTQCAIQHLGHNMLTDSILTLLYCTSLV
jgi:hypothetical protein